MAVDEENKAIVENFPNNNAFMKNSPSLRLYSKVIAQAGGTYVFDVAKSSGPQPILAASLSSNDIQLHSLEEMKCISTLKGHKDTITGIKFHAEEQNLLFSSSLDCSVRIWDTRQNGVPVVTLIDDTDVKGKKFTSFDVMNTGWWLLCAGTELVHEDAFLVFWDVRIPKILGGYWNSHMDEITQVRFNPKKPNILSSAAMDGLVNVYDVSKTCEDDALQHTLNIGSTVGKLNWCTLNSKEMLSCCVTTMEEHQLWCIEDVKPCSLFGRDSFEKSLTGGIDYLIDTFEKENCLHLATGKNNGDLQIWTVDEEKFTLVTELNGSHTDIIRTILWDCKAEILITGGEDGSICCWKSSSESIPSVSKSMAEIRIIGDENDESICCWKSSSESIPSESKSKSKITSNLKQQLSTNHLKKPY